MTGHGSSNRVCCCSDVLYIYYWPGLLFAHIRTGIGIVNVCTTIAKCCARIVHILLGHSIVSNKLLKPGIIGFMGPLYFSSLDFDSLFSLSDFKKCEEQIINVAYFMMNTI